MAEQAAAGVLPPATGYPEEPIPYVLLKPVTFVVAGPREGESITIDRVEIRELTGDDLINSRGKTDEEKGARLLATACDQPYAFIKKLTAWDFANIGLAFQRFFPKGLSPLEDSPPGS